MLHEHNNRFTAWLRTLPPQAKLCFDSGFPQVTKNLADVGINLEVRLPLKPRDGERFETHQAECTRLVTRWRGVVERANSQLKLSRLLSQRFSNSELPSSEMYWKASAIIANKYYTASLVRFAQEPSYVVRKCTYC
jgi:hypothetical protein